ncbi:DUF938 domain-containing protein [Magnetospirillum sp. 64-120]|uniref:DUF938 domain-containing protein n=1 Tax=Magnetospirillum sp. 64-120 TaxID=1895778 RepID=UPI0009292312|nr:DUF938 domain-containing protein [Magnetospirillum sp. 64-120]OJX79576.1 MAG: SAM-dependent methyltransferase [Magnetospirillum sp. 64-120]
MKRDYPATSRNKGPILDVLRRWLPPEGVVLEIASGSGQHASWFASQMPGLTWQPSDADAACLPSIDAWGQESDAAHRIRPALHLDVAALPWPLQPVDAVFCANMIHIAPWTAAQALAQGAGLALRAQGLLVLYGPFKIDGRHTAPSNQDFDDDLRRRNPLWGVRDLADFGALAQQAGLDHVETVPMPANNLCVIWRKRP